MPENMKFGECLRYLLSVLDISIVKLSKIINVDSSLVNRWVNEKRTPAYNTDYIEKISEYLSSCVLNSFQLQYLDSFYLNVCGDSEIEISTKEKIKKILFQSQGYSIECRKNMIKENKADLMNNKNFLKSIGIHQNHFNQSNDSNLNSNILNTQDSNFSISLSSEDKIVIGYKNVLATSISLLEDASKHKCNNGVIYISFNNNMFVSNHQNDLITFRNAMLKAMNTGWNIIFLLKLDNNVNTIIKFIDFAQSFIYTTKFHPYYFKKYDLFPTYQEFIVIPQIGALLGLSNNTYSEIDAAFYFRNKVAIDILKNKVDIIIRNHTNTLVKYYRNDNAIDYSNFLSEQEDIIGNRILYKRDFSILMFPENLYKKLLHMEDIEKDEINISLEFYKRRLKSFLSNIYNYKHTDICHIDCINNLIKYRKLYLYSHNKISLINLDLRDVINILKNMVYLLKKYDNYNIVFISQNSNISDFIVYCMLKERNAVIMETYEYSNDIPIVRMSIKEPMLVKAFEVYFNEVLDHIAPMNKDKNEIINWIEHQINLLEKQHQECIIFS